MRVTIFGTGGVGGYFGAKMAEAGINVTFIARGEHLRAIKEKGLRIIEDEADTLINPVNIFAPDDKNIPSPDVIIFAVKLTDTEEAAIACQKIMHENSFILTLQNGVESVGMIEKVIGQGRVIGGSVYVVSSIIRAGIIKKSGPANHFEFAECDGRLSRRAKAFEKLCIDANIDARLGDNLPAIIWGKFLLLSATSAITAMTRKSIGFTRKNPEAYSKMTEALDEAIAVSKAHGVNLPADAYENTLHILENVMHDDAKASLLVDLEKGKPLELEWLSGAIHRLGEKYNIPTPVHTEVYETLKPFAQGLPKGQK